MLELAILLAVGAAIVWILSSRGFGSTSPETLRLISIVLLAPAAVALLLELLGVGGGPPREIRVPLGG